MNFLLSFVEGSKSAEGAKNPLADMARGGPILEGSKSAGTTVIGHLSGKFEVLTGECQV